MSVRIPTNVRREIFAYVYAKADEHHYLEKTRPENTAFMENLEADAAVGKRLENYMSTGKVKTYIKDTILNKYAKDRKVLPRSIEEFLSSLYGETLHEIEYRSHDRISLHRLEMNNLLIATVRTMYIKWETGLRKLLLYVASLPDASKARSLFSPHDDALTDTKQVCLVLIIFQFDNPVNEADKRLTTKALELVGVKCLWA